MEEVFLGCYGSSLSGDGLGSGRRERFLISAVRGGDGVSSGQEAQTVCADLELGVQVWPNVCCVCACKPEKQTQLLLAARCHVLPQTENLLFLPIPADTVSDTV